MRTPETCTSTYRSAHRHSTHIVSKSLYTVRHFLVRHFLVYLPEIILLPAMNRLKPFGKYRFLTLAKNAKFPTFTQNTCNAIHTLTHYPRCLYGAWRGKPNIVRVFFSNVVVFARAIPHNKNSYIENIISVSTFSISFRLFSSVDFFSVFFIRARLCVSYHVNEESIYWLQPMAGKDVPVYARLSRKKNMLTTIIFTYTIIASKRMRKEKSGKTKSSARNTSVHVAFAPNLHLSSGSMLS